MAFLISQQIAARRPSVDSTTIISLPIAIPEEVQMASSFRVLSLAPIQHDTLVPWPYFQAISMPIRLSGFSPSPSSVNVADEGEKMGEGTRAVKIAP